MMVYLAGRVVNGVGRDAVAWNSAIFFYDTNRFAPVWSQAVQVRGTLHTSEFRAVLGRHIMNLPENLSSEGGPA